MIFAMLLYGVPVALLVLLVLTLNDIRKDVKRIADTVAGAPRP